MKLRSTSKSPGRNTKKSQKQEQTASIEDQKKEELRNAVFENNKPKIKSLLEEGVSPNLLEPDRDGLPILCRLAAHGNNELIELYVSKGGNLENIFDENCHWNPIHWAVFLNHLETVKYLISIGIDHKAKDKGDKTPLEMTRRLRRPEINEFLEEIDEKEKQQERQSDIANKRPRQVPLRNRKPKEKELELPQETNQTISENEIQPKPKIRKSKKKISLNYLSLSFGSFCFVILLILIARLF